MAERPIKLTIAALGGQGGGVLTAWLISIAAAEGYIAQSTSVPGVAQRTGATIYYLEFFPRSALERAGREPVMALMPVPGDVDCVLASELAEAGRAIQRGLVTSERTTLIASTHRAYSISEKSALGQGAADLEALLRLVRGSAQRLVLFNMEEVAERHQSVISSVLLGALAGSAVLPFRKESFAAAISAGGRAVEANLAAFEDAWQNAQRGDCGYSAEPNTMPPLALPERAPDFELQELLERLRRLPQPVQSLALQGVRRLIDYQDSAYAGLYLDRVEQIAVLEARLWADASSYALLEAVARGLALWMSFEDTIRVADLKTRSTRFARVRQEVQAAPGQLMGITEFMKPRVAEIAGTLPARVGRWVLKSRRASGWLSHFTGGRQIRTTTLGGFLLLHGVGGLRRWRRGTLRFQEENERIEAWLARIEALAPQNYTVATELARAQRLIKGYGDTHERGWRNFNLLVGQLDWLAARSDGGALLARLAAAALADEEGVALGRELQALRA